MRRQTMHSAAMRAHLDAPRRAVEHLLFLETRPVRRGVGNLVSAGALGWVRFWECHAEGALIAQFNAGHRPGASVSALCTDRRDFHFLVSGDTDGYVGVWYVPNYAVSADMPEFPSLPPNCERFQLLREEEIHRQLSVQQGRFDPPSAASAPDRTWTAPLLITAFRAHVNVCTALDYIDDRDCIVSCSDDCSVRMWTVYGAFVGLFGQETPWLPLKPPPAPEIRIEGADDQVAEPVDGQVEPPPDMSRTGRSRSILADVVGAGAVTRPSTTRLKKPVKQARVRWQSRRVPADVRRVASACTLRTMYGGQSQLWKSTMAKIRAFMLVYNRLKVIHMKHKRLDDADDAPVASAAPVDVMAKLRELPSVEHSHILGKSYTRQRRYRPMPTLPPVLQSDKVLFSSLCVCILKTGVSPLTTPQ